MNWLLKLIDKKYKDLSIAFEICLKEVEELRKNNDYLKDMNESIKEVAGQYADILEPILSSDSDKDIFERYKESQIENKLMKELLNKPQE